ncbi:Glycogen synthase, ADP-glucose transglucosylase [Minicystis rosea]|nr:Glycogen synthase, ADP-glucose transglucosylase [Minicystis rosea]
MHVLLVSPELSPIQKVGGVGDGVAGLAKALHRFGHAVTIALPWAGAAPPVGFEAHGTIRLAGPDGAEITVDRHDGRLDAGLDVILLSAPSAPPRRGVYGSDLGDDLADARRFALYARAVIDIVIDRRRTGPPFDVVHAHEWPAAPIPYLLRRIDGPRPRTVMTVHNLAFQGVFAPEALAWLGLGRESFHPETLELFGRVDFLKAGLVGADVITTVSPTYAREIRTPERGEALDGVLRARARDLVGITNGIDTDIFNPATDPALTARFDPDDLGGKARCKAAFCETVGLAADRPLVASLGRLVDQKGTDLLAEALPAIVTAGAVVIVAGAGDPAHERAIAEATARAAGRAVFLGRVDDDDARRLLAAADLVVMPSRFEPCGVVQLEAQRYGALPIARRTGGLADTIADASPDLATGTGFLFDEATAPALAAATRRALHAMTLPGWDALRARAMRAAPSWTGVARRYEAVYRGTVRGPLLG